MDARTIVRFPKPSKRGAKVRHGPCASITKLPVALSGDALAARWAWLSHMHSRWDQEETEGTYDDALDWEPRLRIWRGLAGGDEKFGEADMHREIRTRVAHIRKRVEVKDWLETLGIDWNCVRNAEDALFFLADLVRRSEKPLA